MSTTTATTTTTTTTTTGRDVMTSYARLSWQLSDIEYEASRVRAIIEDTEVHKHKLPEQLHKSLQDAIDKLREFTLSELSKCDFRDTRAIFTFCSILGMVGWPPIQFSRQPAWLFIAVELVSFDANQIVPITTSSVYNNDAHPCFLELSLEPGIQLPPATHPDRPKFILPFGRLLECIGYAEEEVEVPGSDDKLYRETGYVVVIDALSASKALWIVFNHSQKNDLGDRVYVTHADMPKPFPGITEDFAIAQIAPSLEDWLRNRSDGNDISVIKNIRDTMEFGTPKLSIVTKEDVTTTFRLRESK